MHLRANEQIVKTFYHHATPFVFRVLGFVAASLPFYLVASFFSGVFGRQQAFIYLGITVLFGLIIAYDAILYFLDRLIITNQRVLHIDWKNLFSRSEFEAELSDIQDIRTEETGFISFLSIFDYGTFKIETASTKTTIAFTEAPDPEGIKHFIYHLNVKPHRIGPADLSHQDDKARHSVSPQREREEIRIAGERER